MKENKLFLFLAAFRVFAMIAKIIVSFGSGYMIPQGWSVSVIVDILAVYIFITSTVKHKWTYLLLGAIAYTAITCLLATLSMLGLAYQV